MVLVFGGSFQGKLEFAKRELNIKEDEVLNIGALCEMSLEKNDQDLNYSVDAFIDQNIQGAKCIYGLDHHIRNMVSRGLDSDAWLERVLDEMKENASEKRRPVIIMNDVSQGLVPMDGDDRAFREANGRALIKLAAEADEVYRVFAGLGTRIKGA